jgi:hypothetical protein
LSHSTIPFSQTICSGWRQTVILLISISWVARITVVSYWRPVAELLCGYNAGQTWIFPSKNRQQNVIRVIRKSWIPEKGDQSRSTIFMDSYKYKKIFILHYNKIQEHMMSVERNSVRSSHYWNSKVLVEF